MRLTRRKKRTYDESSASSDIAFLLIIYFIVIAAFNINRGFLMNLPAKDSTRLILKDDLLRFELDATGTLFSGGEEMSFDSAEKRIRSAVSGHPNLAVVLTAAPETPWQELVTFVELAQRLKVDSFSFTLRDKNSGGI